jgi:hypothetical protein
MYLCFTRMLLVCTRVLLVCTRMLLVCTRMLLVCTRMYSCVTRMYSYVLVCYSYVLVWCFSHDQLDLVLALRTLQTYKYGYSYLCMEYKSLTYGASYNAILIEIHRILCRPVLHLRIFHANRFYSFVQN